MIFSFAEMISFLSRDFTLLPGDVISGGTGSGTAIDALLPNSDGAFPLDPFLKPGDVVEMSPPQISVLRSKIVAKP